MFKKILVVTAVLFLVGALAFGAVSSTLAQDGNDGQDDSRSPGTAALAQPGTTEGQPQGGGNGFDGGSGYTGNAGTEALHEPGTAGTQVQGQANGFGGGGRGGNSGYGGSGSAGNGVLGDLPPAVPGSLSAEETAALLYLREEEKLAHDVYVTLYDRWDLATFQYIAASEQAHTDAVLALIERYGLTDPASTQVGVFSDPALQALYDDLVARGSASLSEAIRVGAAIEEIDILDLEERMAQVDNADILQVFGNLLSGSGNHLRAFVSVLETYTGEIYQPQYLSATAYQTILNTTTGGGGAGEPGGNGQGGGNRGGRR